MPAPTVASVGTPNAGITAATTYALGAHQSGDDLYLFLTTQQTTAPTAPSGWTLKASRAQGTNVLNGAVYYKKATSSAETNPQVPAATNFQTGFTMVVRGGASGDPVDFTPVPNSAASGTTATALAGTTTVADTLVVAAFFSSADTATNQFSAFSAPGLSGLTTQGQTSTTNGGGGGVAVVTGTEAVAGSTGNVTATLATQAWATILFAIKPATGASPGAGSGVGTVATSGSGSGKRNPQASASGSVSASGAGAGRRDPKATGSGSVSSSGSASGSRPARGSGSGSVASSGVAAGRRDPRGSGSGTVLCAGSAAGRRTPKGSGSGGVTSTGSGVGSAPVVGGKSGSGVGSVVTTGTATGRRTPKASGSGLCTVTGAAVGRRSPKGAGASLVAATGFATGRTAPKGSAASLVIVVGSAVGVRPSEAGTAIEVTVGAPQPARFAAAPPLPHPLTAATPAVTVKAGNPLPPRYRRTDAALRR